MNFLFIFLSILLSINCCNAEPSVRLFTKPLGEKAFFIYGKKASGQLQLLSLNTTTNDLYIQTIRPESLCRFSDQLFIRTNDWQDIDTVKSSFYSISDINDVCARISNTISTGICTAHNLYGDVKKDELDDNGTVLQSNISHQRKLYFTMSPFHSTISESEQDTTWWTQITIDRGYLSFYWNIVPKQGGAFLYININSEDNSLSTSSIKRVNTRWYSTTYKSSCIE